MSNNSDPVMLFDHVQMKIIGTLTLLTAGLSFVGSGSILVCVIYHGRVRAKEIFPIFHLSVADGLASLVTAVMCVMFLDTVPSLPGSNGPCGYFIALMICLYISTFFLTFSYALEAFVRLRQRLQTFAVVDENRSNTVSSYCMYGIYFLSWIIPLTLGIFLMLVTHFFKKDGSSMRLVLPPQCSQCFPVFGAQENYCWSYVEDGLKWVMMYRLIFFVPLLIVFILNMVLYINIARDFKQVAMRRGLLSYHQRQEESTLRKKAFLYQSALIICWIPTMILICVSFSRSFRMSDYYVLFILQAVLGPLQGFFNCIIYGWKRTSFRRALTESSQLLNTNRSTAMSYTL